MAETFNDFILGMAKHKEGATLSHRAELFRSKLIDDFQILESTSEQGKRKVPYYSTTDIINPEIMEKVLSETPEQMIKFKAYKRGHRVMRTNLTGHRLTRVSNQKKLPYGVWANLIVESSIFQTSLLVITVLSSIAIGIQGELPRDGSTVVSVFSMVFSLFDDLTIIIFSIEIALKWIDNFRDFWKDPWNVFDLIITVVSVISTILLPFAGDETSRLASVAEQLSVFRILRVLKLVTRLTRLRIVILTVLQTFQSVVFIILLLLIVSFVYSVIGIVIFQSYTSSNRQDLKFNDCFSNIPNTMLTLFQLFTLDQWYNIYQDVTKISNAVVSILYILVWILIGSFVFRNLFVGIMGMSLVQIFNGGFSSHQLTATNIGLKGKYHFNNFQSLSAELVRTKESQGKTVELARLKRELSFEIIRQNKRLKEARYSVWSSDFDEPDESKWSVEDDDKFSQILNEEEKIAKGWDETVEEHLAALASNPVETLWPRDTLFRYYQVMEQLQDNLEEYEKIQDSIAEVLLEVHRSN